MSSTFLLAGWAQAPKAMESLQPALAERGRLLSVAELGEGAGSDLQSYRRRLQALVEGCEGTVTLIGWSMGGMVALETALAIPEKISQLVMLASSSCFCSRDNYPAGVAEEVVRGMRAGVARDPQTTIRRFFEMSGPIADLDHLVPLACAIGTEELLRGLDYLMAFDVRGQLNQVSFPTLIVHGKEDAVIPFAAAEYLEQHIVGSRLVALDAEGHSLCENPQQMLLDELAQICG